MTRAVRCAMLAMGLWAATADSAWAVSREQIESDWLVQDARRVASPRRAATVESDAAGAVDGIKNGEWGFHTDAEPAPWWQVDLKQPQALERVVIWNRCDPGMAARNFRIQVLTSGDGTNFQPCYTHDGTAFYGFSDNAPLVVTLSNAPARFVRLMLAGKSYFHLDEVEVFSADPVRNVALGMPATQSSVSQWSRPHDVPEQRVEYTIAAVIDRGLKLANHLRSLGLDVQRAEQSLRDLADGDDVEVVPTTAQRARLDLYLRARWIVRELALSNPLLDFDSILFVKRAPGMFPHMSDQHYGWWSRGGGGVYVLEGFKSAAPRVRCLTADMPEGSFMGPDLSFDGSKLLFAYCRFHPELADERNKTDKSRVPEDAFYHVYEMDVDGTGRRQITNGKYDDFDARYLPGGDLMFVSTRKGTAIQCSQWFSDSTRETNHPDSYVRCGGDNYRPVPVFTLHGMDADGRNIRPLSAFENFEWTPSVANDGRLLYTRWDYIDRFNGHFFSLWSANQDGSNPQLVYGNYTVKPQVKIDARAIPNSSKLVFVASAHHSIYGGSLCLLDRAAGTEHNDPIVRLTPEVPFPETEANVDHYFANPWPISEDFYLVSWSDQKLPPHCRATEEQNPRNATGIYLYDCFGNLELLHRDEAISSASPIPLRSRPRPAALVGTTSVENGHDEEVVPATAPLVGRSLRERRSVSTSAPSATSSPPEGRVLLQDVYRGIDSVAPGTVKRLRIVGVPPKVQPHMNNPSLGVSDEDPGKFVLGTVPVERDGSAYFRVPSGVPMFFQALDDQGVAVQTMRTLTYAMPGQTLACVGCHEHRESAPPLGASPFAAARAPSKITPGPSGSWPLRFDQLVQPVLDRHCVECHRTDVAEARAAGEMERRSRRERPTNGMSLSARALDLTAGSAYKSLLGFAGGDLKKRAFERDRSVPGEGTAAQSRLWQLLAREGGHEGLRLDDDSAERLLTWLDTYAQLVGHFSDEQEAQLAAFRRECAPFLEGKAP